MRCEKTFVGDFDFGPRELPGAQSDRVFWYPGASRVGGPAEVLLGIDRLGATPWFGLFASGRLFPDGRPSCAVALPDRRSLLVICNGAGYTVLVDNPEDWSAVGQPVVHDPIVLADRELVLVAGFTDIMAWGPQGEAWETTTALYDDLEIVDITGDVLTATGSSPPGTTRQFTVDLRTGEVSEFKPVIG